MVQIYFHNNDLSTIHDTEKKPLNNVAPAQCYGPIHLSSNKPLQMKKGSEIQRKATQLNLTSRTDKDSQSQSESQRQRQRKQQRQRQGTDGREQRTESRENSKTRPRRTAK